MEAARDRSRSPRREEAQAAINLEAVEKEEEEEIVYPPDVQKLRTLDDASIAIVKETFAEVQKLERIKERRMGPVLQQRLDLLTSGEAAAGVGTPGIPNFWATVVKNCVEFEDMFDEEIDTPVLAALRDINVEMHEETGQTGYKLHFHFVENEWFENKTITKTYTTEPIDELDSALSCMKITCTPIQWKDGKNITVKKGKAKKGKAKAKATPVEDEPVDCFFRHFFQNRGEDCELPAGYELDEDEEEEDAMDTLLEEDHECGEALRLFILPHAIRYFTGEACEEESEEESEEGSEEDEDDEDDDEDDEDDDEEEDEE